MQGTTNHKKDYSEQNSQNNRVRHIIKKPQEQDKDEYSLAIFILNLLLLNLI